MLDWLGWCATAVFVTSYFAKQSATLRRIQGLAAGLWAVYGLLIHALPVVVANVIVAGVAVASSLRKADRAKRTTSPAEDHRGRQTAAVGEA